MPGSFFDTNVLLYAASTDESKANMAEALMEGGGTISVQVLNEVTNVARRKMRLSWPETRQFLSTIREVMVVRPITIETHDLGLEVAERYGLSTFDAMIAATALQADCDTLWSEDMQEGLLVDRRLRVRNPFRASR